MIKIIMSAKLLGKLKLNPILWVLNLLMVATPFYSYYMAVSKGE